MIHLFSFGTTASGLAGTNNMARTGKRTVVRCALDGLRKGGPGMGSRKRNKTASDMISCTKQGLDSDCG